MSLKTLKKLQGFAESDNIANELSDSKLRKISEDVLRGLQVDEESVRDWMKDAERALELTQLTREPKHTPMRNASNIKYPLITTAMMQFTARTLPELIKSGDVAKYHVVGRDLDGRKRRLGERLKAHLNYQILEVMPNWLDERDKLLSHLCIVGTAYTKTWFDPIIGVPKSELVPYDEIVVNDGIKSIEEAERISHILAYSMNEIVEHQRFGLFREISSESFYKSEDDTINVQELVEQHCFLDLDDDGYKEPYIVTVHRESGEVLRIVARYTLDSIVAKADGEVLKIFGQNFFNDYHFIPNPNGRFHSIGFGTLLLDMNESVNTILNQLVDAGKLANIQGGFIGAGLRGRARDINIEPGEWLVMDSVSGDGIKNNIVPLAYKEPSSVLFQLLGVIIQSATNLTSTTEALTGTAEAQNTSPTTMLALIQQGLKVYTSIQRRVFRGFKKELSKLVDLNRLYLNPQEYIRIVDPSPQEIAEILDPQSGQILDYINSGVDVVPVADINTSTEAENLVKANALLQAGVQLAPSGAINMREIALEHFIALEVRDAEKLVNPPPDPNTPNPALIKLQSELDMNAKDLELRERELDLKEKELEYKVKQMASQTLKNIADAEAAEAGSQLEQYQAVSDHLLQSQKLNIESRKLDVGQADSESD